MELNIFMPKQILISFILFVFSQLSAAADMHSSRIMLVEDTAFLQSAVTKSLKKCGYEVLLATNGNDAVEKARKSITNGRLIDAFLMDNNLGTGMNGLETMKKIREISEYENGLFILHSTDNEEHWVNYKSAGATDFINKNINFIEYKYKIEKLIIQRKSLAR